MKRGFTTGDYLHITKRGFRGFPIVEDEHDKWRFIRALRYLNDEKPHKYWPKKVKASGAEGHYMPWPNNWPDQNKLVEIKAYTLMPNHFHLLLRGVSEGGVATFMKKVSDSTSKHYNRRHDQRGGLWESTYRASIVNSDQYLRFLLTYVQVKNVFELYPEGFSVACAQFDEALAWGKDYPFSSLADQLSERDNSPVIDRDQHLLKIFDGPNDFKQVAKEALKYSEVKKLTGTDIHLE